MIPSLLAVKSVSHVSLLDSRDGLLLLASFLITFLITRFWVRMQRNGPDWWPRSLSAGDTHVHHLVPGIFMVLISGFLAIAVHADSPWTQVMAVAFGAGAALTLDEYALWLHLEDVYWAEEGRRSVDVIVVALVLGLFVVIGATPFGLDGRGGAWVISGIVVVNALVVGCTAMKGKFYMAAFGIFVPGVALLGACRAARPGSWWANRFYRDKPERLEKGRRRADRWSSRRTRWWDMIGGRHGDSPPTGDG